MSALLRVSEVQLLFNGGFGVSVMARRFQPGVGMPLHCRAGGDVNISEPGALIGFAGPRVIKETIKADLPEGFQRAEFLQEHGFLDFIVDRGDLKERLDDLLTHLVAA